MKILKILTVGTCEACGGRGWYDEGHGREECSVCSGTGNS